MPEISGTARARDAGDGLVRTALPSRRYHKLAELARGGTGRIVAARDLVFERVVALKEALDPARDGSRLRAEAAILASLQHPSIVPIYDAGEWGDGAPFFAMKWVDGRSLRDAIEAASTLAARLALIPHLIAVADAIAAAHAQGVIHRDLKPGNVLVGRFGETVVIDWGLGKQLQSPSPPAIADARSAAELDLSATKTETGAVLGTPAYMAPEQARGEPVDERADVYALGSILYHVLAGAPPFHDLRGADVIEAVGERSPTEIDQLEPRAPADLVAIVNKAMARHADGRYPTASGLADDLRRFQTGRLVIARRYSLPARLRHGLRRRRGAVLAVALAMASAVIAMLAMPSVAEPGARCARSGERMRAVWDPAHRLADRSLAVRASLRAASRGTTDDLFARLATTLDRYSRDWVAARIDACEATAVRRTQSDALLDLRMACLDGRIEDLDALVRELARGQPQLAVKAVQAASKLASLAPCADARALQTAVPLPGDPAGRGVLAIVNRQLATVRALVMTGAYREGLTVAARAARSAEQLGYPPLLAESLYWRAELEERNGDSKAAETTLRGGLLAAADGRADLLSTWLWAHLIFTVGESLRRPADALALRVAAEAAVRRAGNDQDAEARVADAIGTVLRADGKLADSVPYTERALGLRERVLGPDHLDVGATLVNLSNAMSGLDRGAAAQELLERARGIFVRALGRDHPDVAVVENNLGGVYYEASDYARALQSFERAVAIRERVLGPTHVKLGPALVNRAMASSDLGDTRAARRDLERAVAIFEAARGPAHPDVAQALGHLGEVHLARREHDLARKALDRALSIAEHALGRDHPDLAFTLVNLGELAWERGDHEQARRLLDRAGAIWNTALPPDHQNFGFIAVALAQVALSKGELREARGLAERALRLQARRPREAARCQFVLARVLWTSERDRPRARELLFAARATYERLQAERSRPAVDLATWMAENDVR